MERELWKIRVLEAVAKIADESYQRSTWFGGAGKISSPEEVYCELFDDFIFDEFLTSIDVGITDKQRKLGLELKHIMEEYADSVGDITDPGRVYSDPKWHDVRSAARRFLESLRE